MVQVTKGILIECDPQMKQFLLYLDEKREFGQFVLQDLDSKHLFVESDVITKIKDRIEDLLQQFNEHVV